MYIVKKIFCISLLCWLTPIFILAQQKPNADSLFLKAREAAFSDRWAEARQMARTLLAHYPDYHDAKMLIGRTYAWEHKADSARMTVTPLLDIEPDSYDVLMLLVDNEMWSENYDEAIIFIDRALIFYPTDEDFLFKKANALYQNKDFENAAKAVQELLDVNPNHAQGKDLQSLVESPKYADLYNNAEIETRAGNWDEARGYLRQILAEEPSHFLALLLMANTYAFENKFDSARHVTAKLYSWEPENYELLDLMVKVEIWDRKYKVAMTEVEKALEAHPDDAEFLYKKALIQYHQRDYNDALATLDHLLDEIDPRHADAIALKNEILKNNRYRDYILHEYYYEYFEEPYYSHKWITSTGLAKWTKFGTYIGKFNVGHDWGKDALPHRPLPTYQLEFEAYQNLWPSNYLWLNHAVALDTSGFFPQHRGGVEFFQRLPQGLEASLGVRYMYWSSFIMFYTGSIAWVNNLNYWSYRIFLDDKINVTNIFTYRRYFSARPEYFYLVAGYGNYSDDFLRLDDEKQTMMWLWQVGIHKFISPRWFFLASVGGHHDIRIRWTGQAGIRYYFNMFK